MLSIAKLEELNAAGDDEALRRYPSTPLLRITMHLLNGIYFP